MGKNTKDVLAASQPFSLGPRGCLGRRFALISCFSCTMLSTGSLGWLELRVTLAKMHYTYDLKLLNDTLDWHRDSRMHTLWKRPKLEVQVKSRVIGT